MVDYIDSFHQRFHHPKEDDFLFRAIRVRTRKGDTVLAELEAQRLFFPGGHCKGVCLGGYLLQGWYGWNGRVLGPACESVVGLDVITAEGEQIHCDADNHPDLYWAARGAGSGFSASAW